MALSNAEAHPGLCYNSLTFAAKTKSLSVRPSILCVQTISFTLLQAIYTAIFHSISAFCNAGFSLFSDSMVRYSDRLLLNITMCSLIIVGGIGFPVLYDLQSWLFRKHKERKRLSIQTKVVLLTTLVLIIAGAVIFALLECQTLWDSSSIAHRILVPLFQSITCRTAGFNSVNISSLKEATLALMIFLMFFASISAYRLWVFE